MRFLIDTHCCLWWFLSPDRLNQHATTLITNGSNVVVLSAASAWEVAIKAKLGKLQLPAAPEEYVPRRLAEQGMTPLPIQHNHALRAGALPDHHRDPFDRLLVSQSQIEKLPIMTADVQLKAYDVDLIWAGA